MIMDENPDIIVIVGADHVYRMDFWQMVDAHIESGAEFTVSAIRQPISLADQMGVIDINKENPGKIRAFLEKPKNPEGLPDSPNEVLASMGNYVANADALLSALGKDAANKDSKHDMGGDIVPYFVERGTAGVYDFKDNEVPGSFAIDRSYWRDVGTIDQYYEANLDLVDFKPRFNLYNRSWPLLTAYESLPPAKFVHSEPKRRGRALNSIVSPGVIVSGAHFEHCIISSGVRAHSWATVNNSIIFNDCYISRSANIQNAILDKSVYVGEGAEIGVDRARDLTRGFTVTETGITVVPKNAIVFK
jgi:glucose-1-phosphate adenylyltransferase